MTSLILSVLAASLAAVPVWAAFGPVPALGTALGLALVLWPLLALTCRIVNWLIGALGKAIVACCARQ